MTFTYFYFLPSPRGNAKVGITTVPWQRLRMYQQGTDEELFFTNLWLVKARGQLTIKRLEEMIKSQLKPKCLHNITRRGGHTEWYKNLDADEYRDLLMKCADNLSMRTDLEVRKVLLSKPYYATNQTSCPLNIPDPSRWNLEHFNKELWEELV